MAHGLICPTARGIFLDQGLNPFPPAMAGGFLNTGPLGKSPCLEFIFSYSVSSWVKFPRFTAFYVNRACSSLAYFFQMQSEWPSQATSELGTSPYFLSHSPWALDLLFHPSARQGPIFCSQISASLSSPSFLTFETSHQNQNRFKNVPFMVSKKGKWIPK